MDFPVSWTPSMLLSAILDSEGDTQPPIVPLEHTTTASMAEHADSYMPYVPLNISSSNEHEQEVRPVTSNIGMHILPVGPMIENRVALSSNCLERETLSGSYSIDQHSMGRTAMISNGMASSVTVAQVGLSSGQSPMMSLDPLMSSNKSYSPTATEILFDVGPNWPYVGQPVPALNQSSLSGTQMGHSGLIMNQDATNRLVIPDLSRSMSRMQQLGVGNNTTFHIPQSQPRVTPFSSEFSMIYEGDLFVRTDSQPELLTRIEGFRRERGSEVFSFNWPKELQIFRYFPYSHSSFRNCTEIANYVVFRAIRRNSFLRRMQEQSFCSVIELTRDMMMFLIVIDEVRLVGVVCPRDHIHQLERLLRGELQEHPNNQLQQMAQLLHQDSRLFQLQVQQPSGSGLEYSGRTNDGIYRGLHKQQLSWAQRRYVREIQKRQWLHESHEHQRLRQEFVNQLQQQPLFAGLQWQRRVQQQWPGQSLQQQRDQALNNHPKEIQQRLPEELQQQGQQQQQLPGQSIQQQYDWTLHNHPYQQEVQKRLALLRYERQRARRVSQELLQRDLALLNHKTQQEILQLLPEGLQQQGQQQQVPGQSTQQQHDQALHNRPQQQGRKRRLPEELQQQGQQQQQLTGQSLQQQLNQARHNHPQQKERLPEELQQKDQQQDQIHQEQPIISAEQPLLISESEWFKRVQSFLGDN